MSDMMTTETTTISRTKNTSPTIKSPIESQNKGLSKWGRKRGRQTKKYDILIWTTLGGYYFFIGHVLLLQLLKSDQDKVENTKTCEGIHCDGEKEKNGKRKRDRNDTDCKTNQVFAECLSKDSIHLMLYFYVHFHMRSHSHSHSHSIRFSVGFNSIKEIYELKSVRKNLLLLSLQMHNEIYINAFIATE